MKVCQLCLTLCNPMDYTVRAVLQAKILERVAFFSQGDLPSPRGRTQVSRIADRFCTSRATRAAQKELTLSPKTRCT